MRYCTLTLPCCKCLLRTRLFCYGNPVSHILALFNKFVFLGQTRWLLLLPVFHCKMRTLIQIRRFGFALVELLQGPELILNFHRVRCRSERLRNWLALLHIAVFLNEHVYRLSGFPDVVLADPSVIGAYRWFLLDLRLLLIR